MTGNRHRDGGVSEGGRWVRRFHRWLLPFCSVWAVFAWIHAVQWLVLSGRLTHPAPIWALFLPVVGLECMFSDRFRGRRPQNRREWAALVLRLVFWAAFFYGWVIHMAFLATRAQWLAWFAPEFYVHVYLVLRGQLPLTLAAAALWLPLHWAVTIRGRRLRIFTSLLLPGLLTALLTVHLYHWGGVGGMIDADGVAAQPGVKRYLTIGGGDSIIGHPRGIHHDRAGHGLFITYGCTFCPDGLQYTTIIRKDLRWGRVDHFLSGNIRRICLDRQNNRVYAAPWYQDRIYELSAGDLSEIRTIPNGTAGLLSYWEPMDVVKDRFSARLYVGNDVEQALVIYDLAAGKRSGLLNLNKMGLAKRGGALTNIRQSARTGKLFFLSGPGDHLLFRVDPDTLAIEKKRGFFDITGSALALDDENGALYYQKGALDAICEVDVDTFAVRRTLPGEFHARVLTVDGKRRRLYVLGYLSGTVFALDLETGRRVWARRVGGSPHGMDLSGDLLWISSKAGVFQIDLNAVDPNGVDSAGAHG